ncbi:MAG: type II toxin-antitoxin system RelB/DinJ family antitoxin [Acidobacteriia bacterium]|nr:type II toxin-antitoxin system RelB/DinJ family antitoxin [Terriglobia bacterium]
MQHASEKIRTLHAKIAPKLKASVELVFAQLGITTTETIRLFLKQVELHQGLPFSVAIPNTETVAAMAEANNPATMNRYGSFRELRNQM